MVIAGMLIGMCVPFILLTDVYPFFRFGMFAEPVKRTIQTEIFSLRAVDGKGQYQYISPANLRMGSLSYLMRNYYYRGEVQLFLNRIHTLYQQQKPVREWQLLKITRTTLTESKSDTVVVGKLLLQ